MTNKIEIDYKKKFQELQKENDDLKFKLNIYKAIKEISPEERIKAIEDYINWCNKQDAPCQNVQAFYDYKNELRRRLC